MKYLFFPLMLILTTLKPNLSQALECRSLQADNPEQIECESADRQALQMAIGGCPVMISGPKNPIYNPICLDQVLEHKLKGMQKDYLTAFAYLLPEQRNSFYATCAKKQRHDHILDCLHESTPSSLSSAKYLFKALSKSAKSLMINQFLSVTSRNQICFDSSLLNYSDVVTQAVARVQKQLPFQCNEIMNDKEYIKFKTQYLKLLFAKYLDHPDCLSFDQCNFSGVALKIEPKYFSRTISPPIDHKYHDGFVFEPWSPLKDEEARKKFQRMKQSGARHVTFLVLICQKGVTSNTPGECDNYQASLEQKLAWAKVAKQVGLTFDITPFPYALGKDGWEWRGKFKPENVDLWFKNYQAIVRDITQKAYALGAIYQVVATEMRSLHKHTQHWVNLAANLRSITNRPLVMNVSWFEIPHMFWKAYDIIGISAYYPIALTQNSSVKTMTKMWKIIRTKLNILSKLYGKPYQFTEVGYPSTDYGAMVPSIFNYEGRDVDLEEQRRAFEAFRTVWQSDRKLIRALIWATEVPDVGVDMSQNKTYETFNKPAEQEVEMFFKQREKL